LSLWTFVQCVLKAMNSTFCISWPAYKLMNYVHNSGATMRFLNYGYMAQDKEDKEIFKRIESDLENEPKISHARIQLYERTLALCPWHPHNLKGKRFLEISCGHLGGLDWILKTHPELSSVQGLDKWPSNPNDPRVIVGDAQNIPLPDNSVDIILNVEASHIYDNEDKFWQQCRRVLRPGGYMVWTDFRATSYADRTFEMAEKAGLTMVTKIDVTRGVLEALEQQNMYTDEVAVFLKRHWWTRLVVPMWKGISLVPGTFWHRDFQAGRWVYLAACWQKKM